ncbi:MAG: MBL fold metallo-hydrolase [Thainema sp.]
MKRRNLIRYAGAAFLTTLGAGLASNWQAVQAQTSVTVKWLGHTCFLVTGGGIRTLVNPFQPIGCTAGYRAPNAAADLVMISSRLLDEGAVENLPGDPRVLAESGIFEFRGLAVQGIPVDHDREGGRRFGTNLIWKWNQGGLNLVHLGGAAAPLEFEQQVLLGRPDILFVPVGNSAKAYSAQEARAAIDLLNPKIVVPTHYRTQAAADNCAGDYALDPIEPFLDIMSGADVRQVGSDTLTVSSSSLPSSTRVVVMSYPF